MKVTTEYVEEQLQERSDRDVKLALSNKELDVATQGKAVGLRSVRDEEVAKIREDVRAMGRPAVDYLRNFLDNPKATESSKAKTSLELIKLGGHTFNHASSGGGVNLSMSDEAFSQIMKMGREIVDVKATE